MKKIILMIFGFVFTLNVIAQDSPANTSAKKYNYCADVKDGKLVMLNDEKVMITDVVLENGTVITTDANVVRKDGTKTALKAGECVESNGNVVLPMEKMKKENPKKDYK